MLYSMSTLDHKTVIMVISNACLTTGNEAQLEQKIATRLQKMGQILEHLKTLSDTYISAKQIKIIRIFCQCSYSKWGKLAVYLSSYVKGRSGYSFLL